MNRTLLKTLLSALLMAAACPALAAHGPLSSTQRDAWINSSLSDLVAMGLVSDPGKPVDQLTNFQVAGLTAQASQLMAQANGLPPLDSPPSLPGMDLPGGAALPVAGETQAAKSLEELVEEFKEELATLGIDVDKLEDKLSDDRARSEVFAALQKEYLKHTGTDVSGFSRGYMYNYRGFGADAAYPEMD
jgi:cytochrome c556